MGKSKRKKKQKKKKYLLSPKKYERFSVGPITMERGGRMSMISSNLNPDSRAEYMQMMKTMRPEIKTETGTKFEEILELFREYDPLEFLEYISVKNLFINPKTYVEWKHEGKEQYVEYALSLALSQKNIGTENPVTQKAIEKFEKLIEEIYTNVFTFFLYEAAEGRHDLKKERIRFEAIMRYLFVRGDSFEEHQKGLLRGLFQPVDDFLKLNFGFCIEEIINIFDELELQIHDNIKKKREFHAIGKELQPMYIDFVEKKGIDSFASIEESFDEFNKLPEVIPRNEQVYKLKDYFLKNPFEISPSKSLPEKFLDLFSANFGDNKDFIEFDKAPGWPTNNTIVWERPIIKHDNKYYCFSSIVLFRNLIKTIEKWIYRKDKRFFNNVYQKKRADFLENMSMEFFKILLPGAQIFKKLYYAISENNKKKIMEVDGIILYDNNILIVEAKAGEFSLSARRGGLDRLIYDSKKLIDDAYKQGLGTKKYIEETEIPTFENDVGDKVLTLKNKNKYQNIFLVNVTLDKLNDISNQLHNLKLFNLIKEKDWVWSVFINDLRIMSELIDFPSAFIAFLKQRIRANDIPQFRPLDEIDYLLYFFEESLNLDKEFFNSEFSFTPIGYRDQLDRYYLNLKGNVSSEKKPEMNIDGRYKDIISRIESTGKFGFTTVTSFLLTISDKSRKDILQKIKLLKKNHKRDNRNHSYTFYFSGQGVGLTFALAIKEKENYLKRLEAYCHLKMYQTQFFSWYLITIGGLELDDIDFKIFEKEWRFNPSMERELANFKRSKWIAFKAAGKKIKKKDFCPCGSDKKYMDCCMGNVPLP